MVQQTRYGEKFGYFPKNSEEIGTVTIGAPKERGSIFFTINYSFLKKQSFIQINLLINL